MNIMQDRSNYILKHKKYIDYRIGIISYNISSDYDTRKSQLNAIISTLMSNSHNNCLLKNKAYHESIIEIKQLLKNWDICQDGDILGYIYQSIEYRSNLKLKGQYFTPNDVAHYLTEKSIEQIPQDSRILDPACGSGQFLICAYKILYKKYIKKFHDAAQCASYIISRLYGIDLDPIAVTIAKYNLSRIAHCDINDTKIAICDFLNKEISLFDQHLFQNKFDAIIGNPPWRSKFTLEEKKYYRTHYYSIQSGLNTFTLFIERSLEFLKTNGILAYLLPEAFLNIKAHMTSRRFILDNTSIRFIDLWGEKFKGVFAPSTSIILQRKESTKCRSSNIVRVSHSHQNNNGITYLIPQASYYKTPENIFNINHTRKSAELLTRIESNDCFFLKDRVKFFLGIVTGNNTKFISDQHNSYCNAPIIIGKDVDQYKIRFSNHYFNYNPEELQQVAQKNLYLVKNKIVYKFIGKKLTFALDTKGYYTLNNVNGIIPYDSENNIETTLSILNSRIIQYYYQNNFFTLKVLRGNIERLPIKVFDVRIQKRIKKLVSELMNNESTENTNCRETIEDILFYQYNIKDREANIISSQVQ